MDFDIAFYKQLLDHLGEGVYFTDRERRILYWNQAAESISGHPADKILGSFCHDHILQHVNEEDHPLCKDDCPIQAALDTRDTISTRAFLSHNDGYKLPVHIKVSPVFDEKGDLIGAIEVFSDASDHLELETLNQNLRKLIRVDPLTRLPNRRALLDATQKEYLRFARYGTLFSVIFIEIEFFDQIIASTSQETGAEVLQWFARKLLGGFRKADMPSRWSGHKFVVLLPNTGVRAAEKAAEKIRQKLTGQLCPETGSFISTCFGVTEITRQDSIERLLQRAERALKQSKEDGKGEVVRL